MHIPKSSPLPSTSYFQNAVHPRIDQHIHQFQVVNLVRV